MNRGLLAWIGPPLVVVTMPGLFLILAWKNRTTEGALSPTSPAEVTAIRCLLDVGIPGHGHPRSLSDEIGNDRFLDANELDYAEQASLFVYKRMLEQGLTEDERDLGRLPLHAALKKGGKSYTSEFQDAFARIVVSLKGTSAKKPDSVVVSLKGASVDAQDSIVVSLQDPSARSPDPEDRPERPPTTSFIEWPLRLHRQYYVARRHAEANRLAASDLAFDECERLISARLDITTQLPQDLVTALVMISVDVSLHRAGLARSGGFYAAAHTHFETAEQTIAKYLKTIDEASHGPERILASLLEIDVNRTKAWTNLDRLQDRVRFASRSEDKTPLSVVFTRQNEQIQELQQKIREGHEPEQNQGLTDVLVRWHWHGQLGSLLAEAIERRQSTSPPSSVDPSGKFAALVERMASGIGRNDSSPPLRALLGNVCERAGDHFLFTAPAKPIGELERRAVDAKVQYGESETLYLESHATPIGTPTSSSPELEGIRRKLLIAKLVAKEPLTSNDDFLNDKDYAASSESAKQYLATLGTVITALKDKSDESRKALEQRIASRNRHGRQTERFGRDERQVLAWLSDARDQKLLIFAARR